MRGGGGFAVAGERDVVEPSERVRDCVEGGGRPERSAVDLIEQSIQLVANDSQVDFARRCGNCSVDRAVDAIEVARLVRIQVDPDGQALTPPTDHRVDEAVVFPGAAVLAEEGVHGWRCAMMVKSARKKKPTRARSASNGAGEGLFGLWEGTTLHIGGKNGLS